MSSYYINRSHLLDSMDEIQGDLQAAQDALGEAEALIEDLEVHIDESDAFLLALRDYLDQRADADCDQDGYIPNEEMRMLGELDALLAQSPLMKRLAAARKAA